MHNGEFGYGLWPLVIGNVIFIMFVLSLIYKPRTSIDWRNMGAVVKQAVSAVLSGGRQEGKLYLPAKSFKGLIFLSCKFYKRGHFNK